MKNFQHPCFVCFKNICWNYAIIDSKSERKKKVMTFLSTETFCPCVHRKLAKSNPKGDQFWVFLGRTDAKAETPVLWPPHAKSWLIGKDSDAGRDWGQEEKGMTEDEMAGWHHRLDGHEFEWTPGVGDGQGGLACCNSWGCKVGHDWATELNWTELNALVSK